MANPWARLLRQEEPARDSDESLVVVVLCFNIQWKTATNKTNYPSGAPSFEKMVAMVAIIYFYHYIQYILYGRFSRS